MLRKSPKVLVLWFHCMRKTTGHGHNSFVHIEKNSIEIGMRIQMWTAECAYMFSWPYSVCAASRENLLFAYAKSMEQATLDNTIPLLSK